MTRAGESPDAWVGSRLRGQLSALERWLESASDAELRRSSGGDGWSAHEILAHLTRHQALMAERLERISSETAPRFERYRAEDDPEWAAYRQLEPRALVVRLLAQRDELVAWYERLEPEVLRRRGVHPLLGAMDVSGWLEFFLLHEAHHLYQLRLRLGPIKGSA